MPPLWLILGIAVAVILYGSLIAFLVVTTRENYKERERLRDPYEARERAMKVQRALDLAGYSIDPQGRKRLGLDRMHRP